MGGETQVDRVFGGRETLGEGQSVGGEGRPLSSPQARRWTRVDEDPGGRMEKDRKLVQRHSLHCICPCM